MIEPSMTPRMGEIPEMDEPDLEIDILSDEPMGAVLELDDGGVEITIGHDEPLEPPAFDANLAEFMEENDVNAVASDLMDAVDADNASRKDWMDTFVAGLDLLGLRYEERTDPWQGACGVYSSILSEAAIRFQADCMSEIFPAAGPVKTRILGATTKAKEEAAERVQEDMNYQITEVMTEYRPEHERLLYSLSLAGSAFKKVYFDPALDRQAAMFISAEDMLVSYGASTIEAAERVTHIMRKTKTEMRRLQASGFYRDVDLGEPQSFPSEVELKKAEDNGLVINDDQRYTLYEVHAFLDLPGFEEDLPLPYIVTIDKGTNEVLSIRRNWSESDPLKQKRHHFSHYTYVPGFGFYGYGLIHIVGGYARAGTSLIRQLVDAGSLANLSGGLKSRGLRIKGDDTPIAPGEFRDVDVPSGNIRDNIMPLPYKEPSQTLLALLNRITEEGRRLAAISDMNISDMSANAPVGTTLALLERTLKPMAAVQARVHYAMKQEFKLLKAIIAEQAPEEYDYDPSRAAPQARRSDYAMVDVIPVSDPNSSTMAQRVVQYQAVHQLSQTAPQVYDIPYLHRQMIEVLGIKNADKIVPIVDDQKPKDPVSENMAVLTGKPVKAFIYQDHDAHIASHQMFMQDPMIAQTMGQNPMAQQMMMSLQAHIAEHLAFSYRKKLEEQAGVSLPAPDVEMSEDIEVQLSRLVARAQAQLTQVNQKAAAQQQAQQQAQDPLNIIQQKELAIKEADVQRKAAKDQTDSQLKARQQALQERKQMADEELKEQKNVIDAQRAGVMGRSADAAILAEDRRAALELMKEIRGTNAANDLGNSGQM